MTANRTDANESTTDWRSHRVRLHINHIRVLRVFVQSTKPLSCRAAGAKLDISHAHVANLCSELADEYGLLHRGTNVADPRGGNYRPTMAGRRFITEITVPIDE